MVLERPELFDRRDLWWFLLAAMLLFLLQLAVEYSRYIDLTRFDDAVIEADVLQQYLKTKKSRQYHVLKLKSMNGAIFYTTGPETLRRLTGYKIRLRLRTDKITFPQYIRGFFAYSDIVKVYPKCSLRTGIATSVARRHADPQEGAIYAALFTASPMPRELRERLSGLGISHLLAISGFHLGVLSFVLYWLIKPFVARLQSRYMPYMHLSRVLFVCVAAVLFAYLAFLDYVPSLLRAFTMMLIGFWLYDRGLKVLSMQTLAVAVIVILALWPRLLFSLALWLSVGGVYFILLFLHHFSHWHKGVQFIAIHIWVYLMMLPLSLWIFGIFSPVHLLSIVWSMLFILFYPMVLLAHVIGFEWLFSGLLSQLLNTSEVIRVSLQGWIVAMQLSTALAAYYYRRALWLLFALTMAVFVGAVYQVA